MAKFVEFKIYVVREMISRFIAGGAEIKKFLTFDKIVQIVKSIIETETNSTKKFSNRI